MECAAEDMQHSCQFECFVFITGKGKKKRDPPNVTTSECVKFLSQSSLRNCKGKSACPCGSFQVSFDEARNFVLVSVYPHRKPALRSSPRDHCEKWTSFDAGHALHIIDVEVKGKSVEERARFAASKVRIQPSILNALLRVMLSADFKTPAVQVSGANHR